MSDITHDPSEYIRGLQQLLVSDKKKIAFLFGAGTSLAKKHKDSPSVPAIAKMTKTIVDKVGESAKFKSAIEEISKEIVAKSLDFHIETLLSNLEQKIDIIGDGKLNGLVKSEFKQLMNEVKKAIQKEVSIHESIIKDNKLPDLIHVDFAQWIKRSNRKYPIEIFTTNYDYLFELGLEKENVPFYDGFTASYQPFFHAASVEDLQFIPNQTKLWKIHGSLGWHFDDETKKVWRKTASQDDFLIYPSAQKYNESKKQPFTALMDRLCNFLKQPDSILITCGYSFGDEHINERIMTALNTNDSAHVFALYHDIQRQDDKNKDYLIAGKSSVKALAQANRKLSIYGCRQAVIGGQYGRWKLKREPGKDDTININLYYDEDGPSDLAEDSLQWTGEGELTLPDYAKFVNFLQQMIFEDGMMTDE